MIRALPPAWALFLLLAVAFLLCLHARHQRREYNRRVWDSMQVRYTAPTVTAVVCGLALILDLIFLSTNL